MFFISCVNSHAMGDAAILNNATWNDKKKTDSILEI